MNGPLATLRLEMMQQEEKQQEIQSKCIKRVTDAANRTAFVGGRVASNSWQVNVVNI